MGGQEGWGLKLAKKVQAFEKLKLTLVSGTVHPSVLKFKSSLLPPVPITPWVW